MSGPVVSEGRSPVILGFPHTGTHVPDAIHRRLNAEGQLLRDTDWHLDQLYAGVEPDVTTVKATTHRYVIDANRDPSGTSLYPGQNTTTLVPLIDFDNRPIWREGQAPDAAEVDERRAQYHAPYHAALRQQVERVRDRHGVAIVFDCHSIRSVIPFLFAGTLPDFNVGTNDGATCAPVVEQAVLDVVRSALGHTGVVNGRFKGGWTTRHYGRPDENIHAIQLELTQTTYLASETPPFAFDPARAAAFRPHLNAMLTALERLALSGELKEIAS
ncbi:MAG: N-formylglutamate deformylase [Pelagibacterium sp. SCN 63-23]|nr:MAG: N-formylglutamate deformylase [Pelagibacterium sp. SCN 63-23]